MSENYLKKGKYYPVSLQIRQKHLKLGEESVRFLGLPLTITSI
ncbi:hypothetical protein FLA_5614 [Filimonas lacunae]|nr:hypothetical protein FLA_5614 [Filimonas lacunae]